MKYLTYHSADLPPGGGKVTNEWDGLKMHREMDIKRK